MINFFIVYAVIYSTSPNLGYPILIRNVTWLGVQILVFALLLNVSNPMTGVIAFNNLLIFDNFSILVKTVILVSTIITLVLALDYSKYENLNCFEYVILVYAVLGRNCLHHANVEISHVFEYDVERCGICMTRCRYCVRDVRKWGCYIG